MSAIRFGALGGNLRVRISPAIGGLVLLAGCVAVGALVAHGGRASTAIIAVVALAALVATFAVVGLPALLAWISLSAIAYPFVRSSHTQALVTFDRVWIPAAALGALAISRRYRTTRETRLLMASVACFALIYGARVLTAGHVLSNGAVWIDAIILPALLFFAVERLGGGRRQVERIFGALSLAGLVLGVIGIAEKTFGFELATRSGGVPRFDASVDAVRISGPYSVPETYALSLLVCLAATLAWTQLRGRPARLAGLAVAMIELTAIGLTLFRAAWISAIVVVIASFGLRPKRFARTLAVVGVVGAAVYAAWSPIEQNQTIHTRLTNVQNIQGRLATYTDGIRIFEHAPIFGVGPGNFIEAHAQVGLSTYEGVSAVEPAHSSYILLLAEQGIVGFLAFAAAIGFGWLVIRRQRRGAPDRTAEIIGASITGAAFAYVFMSASLAMLPYSPSNQYFAVLLGLAAAQLASQRSVNSLSIEKPSAL